MRFDPWRCPTCGDVAIGTLDLVPGTAQVVFDDDGEAWWTDHTELCWDGQKPKRDQLGRVELVCGQSHTWHAVMEDDLPGGDGQVARFNVLIEIDHEPGFAPTAELVRAALAHSTAAEALVEALNGFSVRMTLLGGNEQRRD